MEPNKISREIIETPLTCTFDSSNLSKEILNIYLGKTDTGTTKEEIAGTRQCFIYMVELIEWRE